MNVKKQKLSTWVNPYIREQESFAAYCVQCAFIGVDHIPYTALIKFLFLTVIFTYRILFHHHVIY